MDTSCGIALAVALVAVFTTTCDASLPTSMTPKDASKPAWNLTWTDRLKHDLLANYDKFARPAQHTNTTEVTLGMTIRHIDLDELQAVMTVHGWVKMSWNDDKLRWNQSEYGGLSVLHIADHEIWQPDIVLYNSATGSTVDHYGNTHCLAYPSGTIVWVPPAQFMVFCDLDLKLWPFDTQVCYMRLGSWTYDGDQVNVQLAQYGVEVELLVSNTEWELLDVEEARNVKKYSCCDEPYIDITYNVTLKRRSPTYSSIVVTPATVIVLMTLAIFWLPPHSGEKVILGGCTAVIICIFLLYFSQKLPAMANHTPLIVLFYSSSLYLVCISMVVSVLVLNLSRNHHATPLPWIIKNPLTGWFGRILCLGSFINQTSCLIGSTAEELREQQPVVFEDHMANSTDDRPIISNQSRSSSQQDWVLLAAAVDRIMFLFYCFLFAILAIAYSV